MGNRHLLRLPPVSKGYLKFAQVRVSSPRAFLIRTAEHHVAAVPSCSREQTAPMYPSARHFPPYHSGPLTSSPDPYMAPTPSVSYVKLSVQTEGQLPERVIDFSPSGRPGLAWNLSSVSFCIVVGKYARIFFTEAHRGRDTRVVESPNTTISIVMGLMMRHRAL